MDDAYLSWSRLAQAHIIMGCHNEACDVMNTASELYPDKWQVWRDFSILSAYCNNFDRMIYSYQKLLDLKKSYTNIDLLFKLAKQIELNSSTLDTDIRKNAMDLFERLIKRDPQQPTIWALFGLIVASTEDLNEYVVSTTFNYLKRSIATCTGNRDWFKKVSTVHQVLYDSNIIAEVFFFCCHIFSHKPEYKYILKIVITFLKKIVSKVEEYYIDLITGLIKAECRSSNEKIQEKLKYFENMEAKINNETK